MKGVTYSRKMFYNVDLPAFLLAFFQSHRYRKSLNRLLKVCYVLATNACLKKLSFFLFFNMLRPLTVLMMQTRQGVHAIKQSILLRCLWLECFHHIIIIIIIIIGKAGSRLWPGTKTVLKDCTLSADYYYINQLYYYILFLNY